MHIQINSIVLLSGNGFFLANLIMYFNVMFSTMMYLCFSIGRLPGQMKDFYKYIRF